MHFLKNRFLLYVPSTRKMSTGNSIKTNHRNGRGEGYHAVVKVKYK
jgi:hypothetical protein